MKKIIFIFMVVAVFLSAASCTKDNDIHNSNKAVTTITKNNNVTNTITLPKSHNKLPKWYIVTSETADNVLRDGGGEDDDKPIVHHFSKNVAGFPIPDASIMMINNTDTVQSSTDSAGHCLFELVCKGNWYVIITKEGYNPVEGMLNITDSLTNVTTTLYLK